MYQSVVLFILTIGTESTLQGKEKYLREEVEAYL